MNIQFILRMKTGTHNKKIQMACPFLTQSLICYVKMITHFSVSKNTKKKKIKATSLVQLVKWSLKMWNNRWFWYMEKYCYWNYDSVGSYYQYQATVRCFLEDDYLLLILRKKVTIWHSEASDFTFCQ